MAPWLTRRASLLGHKRVQTSISVLIGTATAAFSGSLHRETRCNGGPPSSRSFWWSSSNNNVHHDHGRSFLGRPSFSSMVQRLSTKSSANDEDCPLCKQFGNGPCGTLFYAWLHCTEVHTDDYTSACSFEFERFQKCVEGLDGDEKDKTPSNDLSDFDEMLAERMRQKDHDQEAHHAWQTFLDHEVADTARQPFPEHLEPRVSMIQVDGGTLMVSVCVATSDGGDGNFSLLAMIAQSEDQRSVLAASDVSSLSHEYDASLGMPKSTLEFLPPFETGKFWIIALYQDEQRPSKVVVYQKMIEMKND